MLTTCILCFPKLCPFIFYFFGLFFNYSCHDFLSLFFNSKLCLQANSPISFFLKELIKLANGKKVCLLIDKELSIERKYHGV